MAFEQIVFSTSGVILASDHNTLQDNIQNDIWRVNELVAGSFEIYRDVSGYVTGGSLCYTGSNSSFSLSRDASNYVESGTWYSEGKAGSLALYRDTDNNIISGNTVVN